MLTATAKSPRKGLALLGLWIDVHWSESQVADLKSKLEALKPAVQTSELTAQHISTARGWYPEGRPAVLDCLREIAAAFPDRPRESSLFARLKVGTPDDRVLYAYTAMAPDQHVDNTLAAIATWRGTHPVRKP